MTVANHLSHKDFMAALRSADKELQTRLPRLTALENVRQAIVYTYGAKGKELALELRDRGVECLIYDNNEGSRARAHADGFAVTRQIDPDLPLLIGAGQNQIEIADSLDREAYSLAETLYALNLRAAYGPARRFTEAVLEDAAALFELYRQLDTQSATAFLEVLEYRVSLDPKRLAHRRPVGEMWRPPVSGLDIRSFCDIGAYDGDSLSAAKTMFPSLSRSFTIEPNPAMAAAIAGVADRVGVTNINYVGAAWSHASRLSARQLFNGMLVIEESSEGEIPTQTLDALLGDESYDFIKMDVEGTERAVLSGARRSLPRAQCVAVAAYHLPHDFVDLPRQLGQILGGPLGEGHVEGWRLSFAHYSQVYDDSIFYAWRGGG